MTIQNYDSEIEKRSHPENFENTQDTDDDTGIDTQEANDILSVLQDANDDLDRYSVRHGDWFNSEVYEINELIKRARRLLA